MHQRLDRFTQAIQRTQGLLAAQNGSLGEILSTADKPWMNPVAFQFFVAANLALGDTSVLSYWEVHRYEQISASEISSLRSLLKAIVTKKHSGAPRQVVSET